jgi:hypothetical protein
LTALHLRQPQIAKQIQGDAEVDVVSIFEGRALLIQVKTLRKELDERVKKLKWAESRLLLLLYVTHRHGGFDGFRAANRLLKNK